MNNLNVLKSLQKTFALLTLQTHEKDLECNVYGVALLFWLICVRVYTIHFVRFNQWFAFVEISLFHRIYSSIRMEKDYVLSFQPSIID